MIEKFANAYCLYWSEFLDLNHTRMINCASVLMSAKLVQRLPKTPMSFTLGTLAP